MINDDLVDFIRKQVSEGVPEEKFRRILGLRGWTAHDVDQAMVAFRKNPNPPPIPIKSTAIRAGDIAKQVPPFMNIPVGSAPPVVPPNIANYIVAQQPTQNTSPQIPVPLPSAPIPPPPQMYIKPSPEKHESKKYILGIIILLVLLVAGYFGYGYLKGKISSAPVLYNTTPATTDATVVPTISDTSGIPAVTENTTISPEIALDNFAKLNSFTFIGSESGKSALSLIPSSFSGSFSNLSGDTNCSIIHTENYVSSNKQTATITFEYKMVGNTTYEMVKGPFPNNPNNGKWTTPSREDSSLLHMPNPIRDTNSVCKGQLPTLSLFDVGDFLRNNGSNSVYSLKLNSTTLKYYANGKHSTMNFPGGKVAPTGELSIDTKTMLPTKIQIFSTAFPEPLFDFEITSTNTPVNIQTPANAVLMSPYGGTMAQALAEQQKYLHQRTAGLFAGLLDDINSRLYPGTKIYGEVPNTNGDCANPAVGSLFSATGHTIVDPNAEYAEAGANWFYGGLVGHLASMRDKTQGEPNLEMYCYSTTKTYAIEAKIPPDTMYSCIDSSGFNSKTAKKITGPSCK